MKNIYVLRTNKPSRLQLNKHNKLFLSEEPKSYPDCTNQNIYITNSEEIKEGDIDKFTCIFKSSNGMITCLAGKSYGRVKTIGEYYKIILATDRQLIANGVQAIDDEFLDWFCRNSSCEVVGVVIEKATGYTEDRQRTFYGKYKIILPKEEPKENQESTPFKSNMPMIKPKQETIEDELWGNVFAKIKQYGLNNEVLNFLKQNFNISKR